MNTTTRQGDIRQQLNRLALGVAGIRSPIGCAIYNPRFDSRVTLSAYERRLCAGLHLWPRFTWSSILGRCLVTRLNEVVLMLDPPVAWAAPVA